MGLSLYIVPDHRPQCDNHAIGGQRLQACPSVPPAGALRLPSQRVRLRFFYFVYSWLREAYVGGAIWPLLGVLRTSSEEIDSAETVANRF